MQLVYGGYRFPPDLVAVSLTRDLIDDDRGIPVARRDTATGQGTLFGNSQAEITAACAALEAALSRQFQSLVMYRNDGGVAWSFPSALSLNGVRMKGPSYPNGDGAEYSTFRTFSFVCTGDFPLLTGVGGGLLVSFEETVSFTGGGFKKDFLQPVNGLPIRQTLFQATPFRATQTGSAAALLTWPVPPGPLWPGALLENYEPTFKSPQRGPRGLVFGVSWAYRFGSATPLNGRPNRWIGTG